MQKEVFGIVAKWVKERLVQIEPNCENEKSVSVKDDKFPHLNIYGKIDLIEELPIPTEGNGFEKSVRVTDFKTGGAKKKSEIEKIDEEGRMSNYLRQLAMYSYLLEQSPKWKVYVRESRLEFLEAKNPLEAFYDRLITRKEIDLLVQDIADYDNLVKNGEWINRPCNYNSYGKNTECEYCKKEYYRNNQAEKQRRPVLQYFKLIFFAHVLFLHYHYFLLSSLDRSPRSASIMSIRAFSSKLNM